MERIRLSLSPLLFSTYRRHQVDNKYIRDSLIVYDTLNPSPHKSSRRRVRVINLANMRFTPRVVKRGFVFFPIFRRIISSFLTYFRNRRSIFPSLYFRAEGRKIGDTSIPSFPYCLYRRIEYRVGIFMLRVGLEFGLLSEVEIFRGGSIVWINRRMECSKFVRR